MSNPMIDFCEELAVSGLPISAVWAEPLAANRYTIRVSIPLIGPGPEWGDPLVDEKEVPAGVKCTEFSRYPDQAKEIVANDEQVEAMVSELAKFGEAEDWERFENGNYLTKPNKWFWTRDLDGTRRGVNGKPLED